MQEPQISHDKIAEQLTKVFGVQPELKLVSPCKMNNGIVHFLQVQRENLIQKYNESTIATTFFIPSSGSGSRMFQFLYDFLINPTEENRGQIELFLNYIEDFAFFQKLPLGIRKNLKSHDVNLEYFIEFLLHDEKVGLGNLPKGLIPFHRCGPFVLTPFQEQVLQGIRIKEEKTRFHFTINELFEQEITKNIQSTESLTGNTYDVSFSSQKTETNAFVFDVNQNLVLDDNAKPFMKPAGHGALLDNLNAIDSELIFIKNIDNIQHFSSTIDSSSTWKYLGGVALWFEEEKAKLVANPSLEEFLLLNKTFQIVHENELSKITEADILPLLDRPFRVCGMVRNEGQPGGGPFWVEENGTISKQIVEKSQISLKGDQYSMMVQSSYFNPVMIAMMNKDFDGKPYDLRAFRDESKHFVVNKKHQGTAIKFCELPGLWNGSMAYWNSIFVEIPSETFTPVKSVLDLLNKQHKE